MECHLRTQMATLPSEGTNGGDSGHNFRRDIRDARWSPDGRQLITLQIKIQPTILPHFTFLFTSPSGLSNGTSQSSANHITSSQSHQSLTTSLFFSYLHLNSPMAHPIPLSSSAICLSVCSFPNSLSYPNPFNPSVILFFLS